MKYFNISLIAAAAIFAIINRIVIPFKNVFTDYGVILNTPDAYCMVRYAEMLPYTGLDYFANFPDGAAGLQQIVYPIVIKAFSLIIGDYFITAALLPVIFFAIAAIALHYMAKLLFNGRIAAISLFIFCILPGEILTRTMLGAGDYHCLEIMFVALILATIILLCKTKPSLFTQIGLIIYVTALIALYWFSWAGALMIISIISAALLVYVFLNYVKHWLAKAVYIAAIIGLVWAFINSGLYRMIYDIFTINLEEPIIEAQSFFFTGGQFDITTMMAYYGLAFYIVLFGIGWLIYQVVRYRRFSDTLFLSYTLVTFAMMIAHRRFDYYFAISAAIITAYMIYNLYQIVGRQHIARIAIIALAIISLPLAKQSIVVSGLNYGSPDKDWISSCQWLKDQNSANHEKAYYNGSKPDYGTLSWWNYGYWLMAIGHQAVLCHNGTTDNGCSEILLSRSDDKALNKLNSLNMRYVVIDSDMLFNCNGLKTDYLTDTFMYKAYAGQINELKLVYNAGNVRIYEYENTEGDVTNAAELLQSTNTGTL